MREGGREGEREGGREGGREGRKGITCRCMCHFPNYMYV